MTVGENLKYLREKNNITQQTLADKLCVTRSFIAQIERGSKLLSIQLGSEIAKILNCTLEDLCNNERK